MTTCTILGGAPCLHDDLEAIGPTDLRVGINNAGYTFPDLDAVATLHPEHVPTWKGRRPDAWPHVQWYSFHRPECGLEVWRPAGQNETTAWTRGSSSLYAVGVALHVLGADAVYLAGCPLDERPNLYRDEEGWAQFQRYRIGWTKALERGWLENVWSPSGWTGELLGTAVKKAA